MTRVAVRRPLSSTAWAARPGGRDRHQEDRDRLRDRPSRPSAAPAMTVASNVICASSNNVPARPAATLTSSGRRATAVRASHRRSKGRSGRPWPLGGDGNLIRG